MRTALILLGFLAFAIGLLWIGQGLGLIRWPQSSFMIDQSSWVIRGTALAVAGLALVLIGRRRR